MDVKIDEVKPKENGLWNIIGTIDGAVFGLRVKYKMGNAIPFGSLVFSIGDNDIPEFTAELFALIKVAIAKFNAEQHTDLNKLL